MVSKDIPFNRVRAFFVFLVMFEKVVQLLFLFTSCGLGERSENKENFL